MIRIFCLTAVIVLLQACTASVRTTVTSYSADAVLNKGAVYIVPGDESDAPAGLEFDHFSRELAARFELAGFQIADSIDSANYEVALIYGVLRQEKDSRRGHTHFHTSLAFSRSRFGSAIIFEPEEDEFEYVRYVELHVIQASERDDSAMRSIRAVSKGQCEHLGPVFGSMLDAIFKDLNRPDGSIVTITTPQARPCGVRE
jgi:hypothetical protein